MPQDDHRDYFLRRERECRDAADRAGDTAIRQTHLNFAQAYADRAAALAVIASPVATNGQ